MLYTARKIFFKVENIIPVFSFYVAVSNLSGNWFCFCNLFQPNVIGNYTRDGTNPLLHSQVRGLGLLQSKALRAGRKK